MKRMYTKLGGMKKKSKDNKEERFMKSKKRGDTCKVMDKCSASYDELSKHQVHERTNAEKYASC